MYYLKILEYVKESISNRDVRRLNKDTKDIWNIASYETKETLYRYWLLFV